MTHWGWYWKVKKKHKAKPLCSGFWLVEIDSFDMFKNKEGIEWVKNSVDRISFQVPRYNLKARLMDDESLAVEFSGGSYTIPVEKRLCNYGGFYRFFHCPACKRRTRKLYCMQGEYRCRKCAKLGYYTQRLRPSRRNLYMETKVKESIMNRGGSLAEKPPRMHWKTFEKLRDKSEHYNQRYFWASTDELYEWYGF